MLYKRLFYFFVPALTLTAGILAFTGLSPMQLQGQTTQKSAQTAADRPLNSLRDLNAAFIDIAEIATPSVVTVFTEKISQPRSRGRQNDPFNGMFDQFFGGQTPGRDFRERGLGSGIIMTSDGYILTNNHVVDEADSIMVRTGDGKNYSAKVIGTDPKTDIAVIKVEATGLTPVPKGNSDELRVGEMVMAIGSPLSGNLAHTVTSGIVSAIGRSNVGLADYEDFIQTDAAINPGNSGGALINLDGELVGINAAIATRSGGFEGIGFAVPINMASHVMQSLIDNGKVVRGWMGVSIQSISDDVARAMKLSSTQGALVSDILKDSPAERAGLEAEDIIVKVNNQSIRNSTQLRNMIAETAPGTSVKLTVNRDSKEIPLTITLGELPSDDALASAEGRTPQLGFRVAPLDPELAARYDVDENEGGVVVTDVDPDSKAYENGLREGDVIRAVNREPIQSLSEFNAKTREVRRGETVLLRVLRGDSGYFIAFTL